MLSRKNKVIHVTSAHARYDTRIFIKMCSSLAKHDYQVSLIVADGLGDELKNNVSIYDVGAKAGGRLERMTKTANKVFQKAKELDGDIYHLHDPELMYFGAKLKSLGKKIIFDAHEDLPKQLLTKPYLSKLSKILLSRALSIFEKYICKKYDFIISATPSINKKFLTINKNSLCVNNYPLLNELSNEVLWEDKKNEICYVGGITLLRGIKEVIKSLEYTDDAKLNLVGKIGSELIKNEIENYHGWKKVNELGFLNREKVSNIMKFSKAGIVTFLPAPNHIDAQPNKMFEYMSAGLPVIASNFPLWKEIVEGNDCGICVNPSSPKEIGGAIKFILSNSARAEEMGQKGRKAIIEKYNWGVEEKKLYSIYDRLEKC